MLDLKQKIPQPSDTFLSISLVDAGNAAVPPSVSVVCVLTCTSIPFLFPSGSTNNAKGLLRES